MAAYAALLSLFHTLNQIKNHPLPPISLDKQQLHSVIQNLTFLLDFLERYSSEEDDDLESRITTAAYAAEDVVESHIVDQIHGKDIRAVDLHQALERVIIDMDLIKKEAIKGSQHHRLDTNSTASVGPTSVSQSQSQSSTKPRFDDALINTVLDKLTGQQCGLQIIPVVGMGGIGKTTFARCIYSSMLIVQHFDILAWVTISREYSRRKTLQVLYLESIASKDDGFSGISEEELGERLYKKLWGRRYLIVMDDMWNTEAYDEVKSFFPDNDNGSRILITTRLSNLASEVCSSHVVQMQFLNLDKSWDLFCEIVFGTLDCPNELEKIGKGIVRICRGLPLSIVVIGGFLKRSKGTWEYTLQNLNSIVNLEDDEYCLRILSTSYKEMPIHLRPCFLYMGIFPEDYNINVSELIKLWVSEGILKPIDDKSLEDVAQMYLKELIERNLVMVHELRWNGEAKICKIHDLVRDVCLREAKKQKLLCVLRQQKHLTPQGINMERRICIYHEDVKEDYSALFLHAVESASLTRSLLYCMHPNWENDSPSLRFGLLRVYSSVGECHSVVSGKNVIFEHANLRYVSLMLRLHEASRLTSFCSLLWNLQTLKVDDMSSYKCMAPSAIWDMPLLRHVMLRPFELSDPLDSEHNFVLENLNTLSRIMNLKFSEEVVKRISNVKKLKVKYETAELDEEGLTYFYLNNVGRLHKLESLNLMAVPPIGYWRQEEDIRSNLVCFPSSLMKLTLAGTFLYWEELTAKIGSLPLLQILKLYMDSCRGPEWEIFEGQFCSLRVLQISYCDLMYWETDDTVFPRLEHLHLEGLDELHKIPSSIGDITTLKSIRVESCGTSVHDSAKRIKEEQEDNGNEDLQVIIDRVPYSREQDRVDSDEEDQEEDHGESAWKLEELENQL